MKKFLFVFGFILLGFYTFRSCQSENIPPVLDAYGLAQFYPDEQEIVIQDELDSLHKAKTYMTTYANLGLVDEGVDWSKKVYVYVSESYVSLISNVKLEHALVVRNYAAQVSAYDFFHSYWPWLLSGITFALVFGYLMGCRMLEKSQRRGMLILNLVWGIGVVTLVVDFFQGFSFMAETKEKAPVYVSAITDNNPKKQLVMEEVYFDEMLKDKPKTKFVYDWGRYYLVTYEPLNMEDMPLLLVGYQKGAEYFVHLYIMILLILFFLALMSLSNLSTKRLKAMAAKSKQSIQGDKEDITNENKAS